MSHNLAFAFAAESTRCREAKKVEDNLNVEQALERSKWAYKCYPYLRGTMPDKKLILRDTQNEKDVIGYPIFGEIDENGKLLSVWLAPIDSNTPCDNAQKFSYLGVCAAGCYAPDQQLLFSDGPQSILEAKNKLRQDIVTLSPNASLDRLDYVVSELKSYTADLEAYDQSILIIKTNSGGQLKVTLNHPLVDSNGKMRRAADLKKGEKLVRMDGQFDEIESIETVNYFGKVYNVEMSDTETNNNIVVAQGYLNGSVYYQNEGAKKLNRMVLRAGNVIRDSLVK